jgi:protein-S-isoprenylcysteine O-methyltransferase Ste14
VGNFNNDIRIMGTKMPDNTSIPGSPLRGIKSLVGAGIHLLLVGFFLEGITLGIQQWVSFSLSLTVKTQIFMTVPCIALYLFGVIWFNCSLNLREVHLLNRKNELITHGPFSYVRHPLYATLMITMPPLAIIWRSDLIFIVPWALIVIVFHYIVRLEERGLIKIFGDEYKRYQRHVPTLLPFKGSGGQRYRPIRS